MDFKPTPVKIDNSDIIALEGDAKFINEGNWTNQLYREVSDKAPASPACV